MAKAVSMLLHEALEQYRIVGTQDFYASFDEIVELGKYVMSSSTNPNMSLNRPHVGGRRLVHWVRYAGLKFTSVSERPILLI